MFYDSILISLFYGGNMRLFLAFILSTVAVTAFAGEEPVAPETKSVVVSKDCDSCSSCNCRVRRGLFGRRLFIRSADCASNQNGSTYSRNFTVTDACNNVIRSRTYSRTICNGNTCNCK